MQQPEGRFAHSVRRNKSGARARSRISAVRTLRLCQGKRFRRPGGWRTPPMALGKTGGENTPALSASASAGGLDSRTKKGRAAQFVREVMRLKALLATPADRRKWGPAVRRRARRPRAASIDGWARTFPIVRGRQEDHAWEDARFCASGRRARLRRALLFFFSQDLG